MLNKIPTIISGILSAIELQLPYFLENGMELTTNLATGFMQGLMNLEKSIPTIISSVLAVILSHLPSFLESGIQLIANMAIGLLQGIPFLIDALPEIINSIFNAFGQVDWLSIGIQIVQGIINGIASGASALWQTIQNLAANAWQSAKNALGIASPSKVMADEVGKWIPAGMAEGIEANLAPIDASARLMADAAMPDIQPAAGALGVSGSNTAEILGQLLTALREMKFDFYMDGRPITDCVTIRQRNALRAGGVA